MSEPFPGPRVHPFSIGGTPALIVSDGPIALGTPVDEFDDLPAETVSALASRYGLPPDRTPLAQNALVVVLDGRPVLFDTGTGPELAFGPDTGRLIESLGEAGLRPDDIAAVVLTHIHPDHAWGLIDADGRAAFPNALIHVAAEELAFVAAPSTTGLYVGRHRAVIAACSGRLRPFDIGGEVLPGVTAIPTPGHSIAHTSYRVSSGGETVLVLGDIMHHPMLAERLDLTYRYDFDRVRSVTTRRAVLSRCAADATRVLGYHFPWPGLGHFAVAGDGYIFQPD
jgi:glyoxylase-like metal-dependent hydrolase (beta-lactamase superfamily II)